MVLKPVLIFLLCLQLCFARAQNSNISGIINIYTPVTYVESNGCKTKVGVGSPAGFAIGDSVLLIQMKGALFDSSNTASFGNITALNGAGNYEIACITAITGNTVILNGRLYNNNFNGNANSNVSATQLVRIPVYTNATITGMLTCQPWNGSTGGVVIMSVQNNLSFSADIDVTGRGFRGGVVSMNPDGSCGGGSPGYYYDLYQPGSSWAAGGAEKGEGIGTLSPSKLGGRGCLVNGGGGGNKHNTGGGGGSNYTAGGKGGNELAGCFAAGMGGIGGNNLSTYYANDKLFMGGGGGRGDDNNGVGTNGENGGGIVIITAGSMTGNNNFVYANGNTVTPVAYGIADGAGGGGGGGTVFFNTNSINSPVNVQANGGRGGNQNPSYGCVGPGGGGGTGIVLTSLGSTGNINYNMQPGAAGIFLNNTCNSVNFGATPGAANPSPPLLNRRLIHTVNDSTPPQSPYSLTVCAGQPIHLTTIVANSYTWTGPNSYYAFIQNPTITPATAQSAGVYTIQEQTAGICTVMNTVTVSVNPAPSITITGIGYCAGQPINITPTITGATSYTWSGPNGFSFNLPNVSIPNGTAAMAGAYNLTLTSAAGCSITATANASLVNIGSLTVTVNNPNCAGDTLHLAAGGGGPGLSYLWSGPNLFVSSIQNPSLAPLDVGNSGSYTVVASYGSCTASAVSPPITVYPNPTITVAGATVCSGQPLSVTASANPTGSFTWQGPNGFGAATANINFATAQPSVSGIYTVTASTPNACTASATANLLVTPMPAASASVTPNACVGANISLQGAGGSTYNWQGPSGFTSTQQNVTVLASTASFGGTYTLTVSNGPGCSATATAALAMNAPPSAKINGILEGCVPFCSNYNLTTTGSAPVVNSSWQINGVSIATTSFSYCFSSGGNYVIAGTFTDAVNCQNTNTFVIKAYAKPVADFSYLPLNPVEGFDPVVFTADTLAGVTTMNWYMSADPGFTNSTKSFTQAFEEAGTYVIALVVENAKGCVDTIVKPLVILPDFEIYVPNTFTPNDDGMNDVFGAKGRGIAQYELTIYNRWGDMIFKSSSMETGWDGRYKGKLCQDDIYAWKIKATNVAGKNKYLAGHVTLYK